jgi:putative endonuclease
MTNQEVGKRGEDQAALYLQEQGLQIIARHVLLPRGEIDLICRHKEDWVFVEVKTRTRISAPSALDAITTTKRKRLIAGALIYMKKHHLEGENIRFDVVTIEDSQIEWLPGAYEAPSQYTF